MFTMSNPLTQTPPRVLSFIETFWRAGTVPCLQYARRDMPPSRARTRGLHLAPCGPPGPTTPNRTSAKCTRHDPGFARFHRLLNVWPLAGAEYLHQLGSGS